MLGESVLALKSIYCLVVCADCEQLWRQNFEAVNVLAFGLAVLRMISVVELSTVVTIENSKWRVFFKLKYCRSYSPSLELEGSSSGGCGALPAASESGEYMRSEAEVFVSVSRQ